MYRARRLGQAAAAGWALACVLGAVLLVTLVWPSLIPGYGPNSELLESQWSDFAFRYPDSQTSFLETFDNSAVGGSVLWSEKSQHGMIRFERLGSPQQTVGAGDDSQDHSAGRHGQNEWVYQLWLVRGDDDPLIGAGTFGVDEAHAVPSHHSEDEKSDDPQAVAEGNHARAGLGDDVAALIIPFEPGVRAVGVTGVLVTVEPAGGVWITDRSRPVARGLLTSGTNSTGPAAEALEGH